MDEKYWRINSIVKLVNVLINDGFDALLFGAIVLVTKLSRLLIVRSYKSCISEIFRLSFHRNSNRLIKVSFHSIRWFLSMVSIFRFIDLFFVSSWIIINNLEHS